MIAAAGGARSSGKRTVVRENFPDTDRMRAYQRAQLIAAAARDASRAMISSSDMAERISRSGALVELRERPSIKRKPGE